MAVPLKIHRLFPFIISIIFAIISILLLIKIIMIMTNPYYPSSESNIFTMWFLMIEEMMEFIAKLVTAGIYLFFLWITGVITLVSFIFSIQPKKKRIKEDWEY